MFGFYIFRFNIKREIRIYILSVCGISAIAGVYRGTIMKRFISAAFAAAALIAVTGCESNHKGSVTEVSTGDSTAGMTSNYTSQSLQADILTTSAATSAVSSAVTSVSHSVTAVSTSVTSETEAVSNEQSKPSETKAVTTSKAASSSKPASSNKNTEAPANSETTSASVRTTTTSADEPQLTEPTTKQGPAREDIIAAYKGAVSDTIDTMLVSEPETVSVAYTLFDMDGNGIPELILKCGTNEDDMQDTFYTYDDFGLKVICDGISGIHTGFAWDPELNKYVSAYSFMGEGALSWMSYDGSDIYSLKTASFEYGGDEIFEEQAAKNGVEWLPFAKYTYTGDELTWLYRVVSGGFEYDEITGRDFSFIDNYEF